MTTTPLTPIPEEKGQDRPSRPDSEPRGRIGLIVAGSLATGLVAALLLVAAPFTPAEEGRTTGAVLCGFAVGWAMLAVLSVRFTDQPQRWAAAPALFMGLGGLLLLAFGPSVQGVLNWVWPPALLALVIWMAVRAQRQLPGRSGRWLLYPVIAFLALASVGGGHETVRAATDAKAYTFADRYPDEVAGMVLVDSTAAAPAAKPGTASPGDAGSYDVMGRASALVSISARLGLARLYGQFDYGSLPPRSGDESRAKVATASSLRSTLDEYLQANASTVEAASLHDFADKPLVVLTAGSGSAAGWTPKQNAMATLSTNSVHRVIAGATHTSLILEKEYAAATGQAILDVVSSVRSAAPLAR